MATEETEKKNYFHKRQRTYISKLFKVLSDATSFKQRQEILQEYVNANPVHDRTLKMIVECLYHPDVVFDLPAGEPPFESYKDSPEPEFAPQSLFNNIRKVKFLCKGYPRKIENTMKREKFFINMLESMHIDEAKILCMIKEKKIDTKKYKGVTEKLFRKTFPNLLPGEEEEGMGKQ